MILISHGASRGERFCGGRGVPLMHLWGLCDSRGVSYALCRLRKESDL